MIIIYILYFAILNFLIFSLLTQKAILEKKKKQLLISIVIIILLFHFFEPFKLSLENGIFFELNFFSLALVLFHFGGKITSSFSRKINPKSDGHLVYKMMDYLTNYIIYILIFLFQCIYIFSVLIDNSSI